MYPDFSRENLKIAQNIARFSQMFDHSLFYSVYNKQCPYQFLEEYNFKSINGFGFHTWEPCNIVEKDPNSIT